MFLNKILLKISFNHYKKHIVQSLLLLMGITLGVAVIVAIDIANNKARSSFNKSIEKLNSGITHSIYSGYGDLNDDVYFAVRKNLDFQNAYPVLERVVRLNRYQNKIFKVVGIDPFSSGSKSSFFNGYGIKLNSKSFEYFISKERTAFVSKGLLDELGLEIGESLSIYYKSKNIVLNIVGVLDYSEDYENSYVRDKIFVDIATAQEIFDLNGYITRIDLSLGKYSKDKESLLGSILENDYSGAYLTKVGSFDDESGKITGAFELNLTALSLITLLIAFFLIFNSFNYSLVVRRPLFSILRSMGVRSKEIFGLIFFESLIIGITGSLLGILTGFLLGDLSEKLVSRTLNDVYALSTVGLTEVSWLSLFKGFIIGIFSVQIACIMPCYESIFIKPITLGRDSFFKTRFNKIISYMLIVGVFFVLTGALFNILIDVGIRADFLALFVLIIGYVLMLPFLITFSCRVFLFIFKPYLQIVYRFALRNFIYSIDKNFTACASLVIAVSVFLSMTILIESFRTTLNGWLHNTFRSDIFVSIGADVIDKHGLDKEFLKKIVQINGVKNVGFSRRITLQTRKQGELNLIALSENPPIKPKIITKFDETLENISDLSPDKVLISESMGYRFKNSLDSGLIELPTDHGFRDFRIAGVFSDYSTQKGTVIMKYDLFKDHWNDNNLTSISINISSGIETNEIIENIKGILPYKSGYHISTNKQLKESALKIFDQTFAITNAMRIIAFIVAFLGILGALLTLELSKNRDIGIMRSIGIRVSEIRKIILIETGIMGLLSGILSIPLGIIVAYILVYVINLKSLGWTIDFIIKPEYLLEAALVSIAGAFLAGIYPSHKFSKKQIYELIREE